MNYFYRLMLIVFPRNSIGVIACLFFLIEFLLHIYMSNGFWNNNILELSHKLILTFAIFVSWIVIGWSIYYCIRITLILAKLTQSSKKKKLVQLVSYLFVASVFNYIFVCWIFRLRLNVFPDPDAFLFAVLNSHMLSQYLWQAERVDFIALILLMILMGILITRIGFRILSLEDKYRIESQKTAIRHLFLLLLVGNVAYIFFDIFSRESRSDSLPINRVEASKQVDAPFTYEARYNVNPPITLLCNLFLPQKDELSGDISLEELKPIINETLVHEKINSLKKKYNIIFITIESLRSDAILRRHQGRLVMPNVVKLANGGYFFPNCYSTSTHSDYSDPSILSSLYPLRKPTIHFHSKYDPWPKKLLYDILKQHGYATAIFSSQNETWSNMHLFYESSNLDTFFDSRSYEGPTISEEGYFKYWKSATGQIAGKLDDAITIDHTIEWLGKQKKQNLPFFISLNLQTSHFPYERPDGKSGPFQPSEMSSQVTLLKHPQEEIPKVLNAYYNALNYIDFQIGRLLDQLNSLSIRNNTIIVLTGDHGEAFYENGLSGHGQNPLETTTKVGCIINSTTFEKSSTDEYLAQSIDLAPTALGLLGLTVPHAFQGIDLLASDRPPLNQRLIFIHCSTPICQFDSVVSGTGWKYIYSTRTKNDELYFYPTDLERHDNLNASEDRVSQILKRVLFEWRRRQVLYYAKPRYYNLFYPPSSPALSKNETGYLITRSEKLERDM